MKAIEAMGLTKKYRDVAAVDALNISVEQGELFALLGVNGAGKTTTIKMLSCLIPPTSGDACLLGDSVVTAPMKVKEKINLSPQETAVAPNLTAQENLEFICGIYGIGKKEASGKAKDMIIRCGLAKIAGKKARTLSGGWQRRLSIAMSLITEPKILFLDEPTLGLDVLARRELWQMIEELKGKVTVVLTTHYLEEAQSLSDRIGIMAGGRLFAVGTAEELTKMAGEEKFEEAFVALCRGGSVL
ncbi:MAG: ABC transporter ATP-binding protein [Blautia sp.]|jgi:ABC-2 type transport system ATP-binding protein